MSEEYVGIEIGATLVSAEDARNDAEDLAWDHAKFAATAAGLELSSPEFEFIFNEMRTRYLNCAEHLEYLTFNALLVLRTLLNSGQVTLTTELPMKDTELASVLGELSQSVVSAFAWIIAGHDLMWPKNDAMPEVGVTFKFPSEDIIITKD
jgi:hypothetical protein